jgi:hypothetical protein
MSVSDAKESIIKGGGGSLKDRMAALQGKGGFGAPSPPLAPKPAVEKPKWKPPPAIAAPIDDDNHGTGDEPPNADAIAVTLDRTKSSPVSPRGFEFSKAIVEGEETSTAEPTTSTGGDVEGITDPEEEERQRRAAIAARMARLGGARLGMAPPVVAKKPPMPIRKPTREDVPKQEDREEIPKRRSITLERTISPNVDQDTTVASPSPTDSPHVQPQSDVDLSPIRKNSENASLLSVDSTDSNAARSPSMPVPAVPRRTRGSSSVTRRAVPSRKKSAMSPPEVPEVSEERVEETIITPPSDQLEHKAVEKVEETVMPALEPGLDHEDRQAEIHDEPQSIDSDVQHKPVQQPVVENKRASSGESKEEGPAYNTQSPLFEASSEEHSQEHEHEHGPVNPDHHQPDDMDTILKDQGKDDETIDSSDEHSNYHENHLVESDHQPLQQDEGHVVAEPQLPSVVGATGTEEEEENAAEEDARQKRVAERLAKMGGINPFAAPLVSPPVCPPSEDIGHADSPVVSSHSPTLPVSLDTPTRRASLPSDKVAEFHPLSVVESRVEEQGEGEFSDCN